MYTTSDALWYRMDYIEKEMSKRKTNPVSPDEDPSKYVYTLYTGTSLRGGITLLGG